MKLLILLLALALPGLVAHAGQNCEARRTSVETMTRELELAASVAQQLDELAQQQGVSLIVIARAGQDLTRYGLRYSHLGLAYRDPTALKGRGAWRVVHKLNQCGNDRSTVHRQGLAEFFSDGLYRYVAGVAVLDGVAPAAQVVAALQDNATLTRLDEPRYNMLAYPWSGPYQQSNQWAIETLATLADPTVTSRRAARLWLRQRGYVPGVVTILALERLGARIASTHISFDDHPFGQRMAGHIETVTVDSVFGWLQRARLGRVLTELHTQTALSRREVPQTERI